MDRAVREWLNETNVTCDDILALFKRLNKSYTIYGTMLLLPPSAFTNPEWTSLKPHLNDTKLEILYTSICKHLKITHIAFNKPIPLNLSSTTSSPQFNILRSPTSFTPLHGSFGPATCSSPPSQSDFDEAFWITAKQNGIYQTWSPRWTMFSRGNISEKARILTLPAVLRAVEEGPCAGVDLYAGIGYFAFSYVKAGVDVVLGWDLNGWSCEGLRRGGRKNGWVVQDGEGWKGGDEARLVVYEESNVHAPQRVEALRREGWDLPIRHVNCGMLPSSREGLEIAAKVLSREVDGWVHVHENFLVEEIERKAEQTRTEFEEILSRVRGVKVGTEVEYVNRLKSYAPGVMHCVIDLMVYATPPP